MNLLLALCLLFSLPNLQDGRVAPREGGEHCLPSRFQPERWYPIEALENEDNFTLFSDAAYKNLRKSYLTKNEKKLEEAYYIAYEEIAGKKLHLTASTVLALPSIFELNAESFYLSFPWSKYLFIGFLLSALYPRFLLFLIPYLLLTSDLFFRLYLLKRPPVTTMAETYLWVSFVGATIALIFGGRALRRGASLLCTLLFGALFFFDEKIALSLPPPVLNSNFWLTIHVLMVVGSYALFFLGGFLAHLYFGAYWLKKETELWFKPIPNLLYAGVILLIGGTLLGGVWAHVSWGRFWDWDPKEAWAFISALFYLILVHCYRYQKISSFGLCIGASLGLMVITFTWYGVNYLLGVGLHSYGFGEGRWIPYLLFLALETVIISTAGALFLTRKREREKNRRENRKIMN